MYMVSRRPGFNRIFSDFNSYLDFLQHFVKICIFVFCLFIFLCTVLVKSLLLLEILKIFRFLEILMNICDFAQIYMIFNILRFPPHFRKIKNFNIWRFKAYSFQVFYNITIQMEIKVNIKFGTTNKIKLFRMNILII